MNWSYLKNFYYRKIQIRRFKFSTKKKSKKYNNFIDLVILLCIVLSFVTLIYSIGNIIGIICYSSGNYLLVSNIFLKIAEAIFNNLSSVFFLLTVSVFLRRTKTMLIAFLSLLTFFAFQSVFISVHESNVKILYFFNFSNLILYKNLGITSLNMGPVGGVFFALLCSWIINKLYECDLPKGLKLLNGMPITIILVIAFSFIYAYIFLLFNILIYLLLLKINWFIKSCSNSLLSSLNFIQLLGYGLNMIFSPLGFHYIIQNIFLDTYNFTSFLILFKVQGITYNFQFNIVLQKWNNTYLNNAWEYLLSLHIEDNIHLYMNQWISLVPFSKLPIDNNFHMMKIFDWFNQPSFDNNYSVVFGFFLAFGLVLVLTTKKENLKPVILISSFMTLMIILTGKTYAFSLMLLFISPLLYFSLYLPITVLNGILITLCPMHLGSVFGTGLLDYIFFGILSMAKGTNFAWVFLFSGIWFIVSLPILYFVITKKDLPFIGRKDYIIPRLTHRQCHEIFNH